MNWEKKKQERILPSYSIFSLPWKKISSHGMKNLLIPDDNKFVPIADKKKFFSPKQSQMCETQNLVLF